MTRSLFQLNPLKMSLKVSRPTASSTALLLVLPALLTTFTPKSVQAQPKAVPKPAPVLLGVVDEEKLAQSRSDFPLLATGVLPQVAAKRHLTLVVTRRGLKWGQSKVPNVDVTNDVLVLLKKAPLTLGALTGAQDSAARRILSAVGALKSAITLGGISQDDFQSRLTNIYVVYDANLPLVPTGALKTQLAAAMQGFVDSRTVWSTCVEVIDLKMKTIDAQYELKKLNMPEALQWMLDRPMKQEQDKAQEEGFRPLFAAWAKAGQDVDAAQKLMPSAPTN